MAALAILALLYGAGCIVLAVLVLDEWSGSSDSVLQLGTIIAWPIVLPAWFLKENRKRRERRRKEEDEAAAKWKAKEERLKAAMWLVEKGKEDRKLQAAEARRREKEKYG